VDTGDRLLTPGEVAALFRVDPKTVTRWAAAGRIGSIRTPGGHRRFRESEVRALLEGELGALDEEERGGGPERPTENPPNNRGGGPAGQGPTNPGQGPTNPGQGTANPGQGTANPGQGQTSPSAAATPGTSPAGAHVSARPRGTPGFD
jgi:excisionase family DNA binding protein